MPVRSRVNAEKPAWRRKAKLGQNFLRDREAARRIVGALGGLGGRTVVEIGPGQGVLTELLAESAQRLVGIELDRVLAAQLRMRFARRANVEIIEANVLEVNFRELLSRRPGPLLTTGRDGQFGGKADVIGNLPYYITADILLLLFAHHDLLERVVIMVQREVGERIAAAPGGRDYGLLSATAQLHAQVEKLMTLPPGAFAPPPKVHSTVLRLTIAPRWQELGVERDAFLGFLKLSFGQKRKTLANNLKARFALQAIAAALKSASVRADARAESLDLEQAARVWRELERAG